MKKNISLAVALIVLLGISYHDISRGKSVVSWDALIGAVVIFTATFFLTRWLYSSFIESTLLEEKLKSLLKKSVKVEPNTIDMITYQTAKKEFYYLSKERLMAIYKKYQEEEKEDMKRLALEEILVEKEYIEYSPMHEKLHSLK